MYLKEESTTKKTFTGFLMKTPLKFTVVHLQDSIKRICPYSDDYIYMFADELITKSAMLSAGVVFAFIIMSILTGTMNAYAYAMCVLLTYVVFNEYVGFKLYNLQKRINREFAIFLSTMKTSYSTSHSIIASLRSSAELFSIEIQRYAIFIERILTEDDAQKRVREYTSDFRNSAYIRLFISSCYQCLTVGDSLDKHGASIFNKNLQIIIEELKNNNLHEDKIRFKFMGFSLMTVAPSVFLNLFGNLGLQFSPSTSDFYDSYGFMIQLITFLMTWYIYRIILDVKTRKDRAYAVNTALFENLRHLVNYEPKGRTSERLKEKLALTGHDISPAAFVSKMFFFGFVTLAIAITLTISVHADARQRIINNPTTDINVVGYQRVEVINCIVKYSNLYKDTWNTVDRADLEVAIGQNIGDSNSYLREQVINAIEERIKSYQKLGLLSWKQYLGCIFAAFLVGFSPYISLFIQYMIFMGKQSEEVRLFQITILLMKDTPRLTVLSLLEAMESQSFIYRPLLIKVTNEYPHDPARALRFLRASCSQKTDSDAIFFEIVNSLCNVIHVGSGAFADIENDIEFAKRLETLNEEMDDSKSAVLLETLSYVPSFLVVGVYFILPFIVGAFSQFGGVEEIINKL